MPVKSGNDKNGAAKLLQFFQLFPGVLPKHRHEAVLNDDLLSLFAVNEFYELLHYRLGSLPRVFGDVEVEVADRGYFPE